MSIFIQGSDIKQLGLLLTSLVQNNRQYFKKLSYCCLALISNKTMIACYHQIVQSAVQFSPVAHYIPVTDTCSNGNM